jgi:hypothetical protein
MTLCETYKTRQWKYLQRVKQGNEIKCNVHNCLALWESQKSYPADLVTHKRNGRERCLLTDWEDIRNEISWGNCHWQKKDVQDRTWFTDLEADGDLWNLTYKEERKWEPLRQNAAPKYAAIRDTKWHTTWSTAIPVFHTLCSTYGGGGLGNNSSQLSLKLYERYIKHSDIPPSRFDVSTSRNEIEIIF